MATGTDIAKSSKGSEEVFDICCSPCSEADRVREGKQFCENCGSYFCDQCLRDHNKFAALRSHRIVDKSVVGPLQGGNTTVVGEPTDRCVAHCGKIVDMFCKDHDEVCCEACVTIKHRSCSGLNHIKNVAKGITNSMEFKDTKDSLEKVITKIKQEKDKRTNNLSSLNEKKDTILQDIDKYQDDIINRIKVLADASRKEVISKHAELVKATESDAKELDTIGMLLEDITMKVDVTSENEAQIFTNVKNGKKAATDVESIVDELSSNWTEKDLEYCFDNEPADMVLDLKTFGRFPDKTDTRPYLASIDKKCNVKVKSDSQLCDINCICILGDGTFVISDYRNDKLKRLGKNFEVTDSISLDGSPISLCTTEQNEVAAALREQKKVQFVSCGKTFSLGDSFKTDLRCTGLYFDSKYSELYVSCGAKWQGDQQSKVNVYKKNGTLLRTYGANKDGTQLFSSPNNITMATATGYRFLIWHLLKMSVSC
ncbi:uncharacterized protein LOC123549093 isoform X2 [Mercenaria mercenaria]|uniref:uncharacterized protein LOC123549093 isoform X2 n=1 Tax=Mercenaria mercenaria TaxID=6596 RepID=UPI00234F8435|nr:uncharacterized protein LOC123549093 isoform X2 [Mercenaria mercenaria]